MKPNLIDYEHINVLTWLVTHPNPVNHFLPMTALDPVSLGYREVGEEDAQWLGALLARVNVTAQQARLSTTEDFQSRREPYQFRIPRHTDWGLVELMKAVDFYVDQSSGGGDLDDLVANDLIAALRQSMNQLFTGYRDAASEITADTRPIGTSVPLAYEGVALRARSFHEPGNSASEGSTMTDNPQQSLTLYTTPSCPGCMLTKKALERAAIGFVEVDLSQESNANVRQMLVSEGLASAPILQTPDGERTAGYRPDRIRAIIDTMGSPSPRRSDALPHQDKPPTITPPTRGPRL